MNEAVTPLGRLAARQDREVAARDPRLTPARGFAVAALLSTIFWLALLVAVLS